MSRALKLVRVIILSLLLIATVWAQPGPGSEQTFSVDFGVSIENSDEWRYDRKSIAIPSGSAIKKIWIHEHRRNGNIQEPGFDLEAPGEVSQILSQYQDELQQIQQAAATLPNGVTVTAKAEDIKRQLNSYSEQHLRTATTVVFKTGAQARRGTPRSILGHPNYKGGGKISCTGYVTVIGVGTPAYWSSKVKSLSNELGPDFKLTPSSTGPTAINSGSLLFYSSDGVNEVANPKVVGGGGWQQLPKVFSGGDGIIYAVNPAGQLIFYRDANRNGTGDVGNPKVIGGGGWQEFTHLFSGGDGIIYAVNPAGQLIFYRDANRNGTGDVGSPKVIGGGGWQQFTHLFSGGNGLIYAVDPAGRLLLYRDATRNGTGDVGNPKVIGQGGWLQYYKVFSGGGNVIYAITK